MRNELPVPDKFGNYWLSDDVRTGPAIFPSKKLIFYNNQDGEVKRNGTYFLLVNSTDGFVFEKGGKLKMWTNPDLALQYLIGKREKV